MRDEASTPSFLGSGLFRALSVIVFLAILAAVFALNPGGSGSAAGPLTVRVAVHAEIADWAKAAADDFNKSQQNVG